MFVGASGIGRVVERTVELMKQHDTDDVRPLRRHRRRHAAALPQLPLLRVARPVRRRDVDQRGQLLRRRAEGSLPGGAPRRRPPAARTPRGWCRRRPTAGSATREAHLAGRAQRDAARRLRRRLPEGRRSLEPHARRGGRVASPAARRLQPQRRHVRRPPRQPRRPVLTEAEWDDRVVVAAVGERP